MRSLLLILFLSISSTIQAQFAWTHDPNFQATQDSILSVHGIAVDGEGKVWVQPFYASETIVMNRDVGADGVPDTLSTRVIYIYNPDGTQASFSPLKVINYADGSADTLGRVWYPDETDAVDAGFYEVIVEEDYHQTVTVTLLFPRTIDFIRLTTEMEQV